MDAPSAELDRVLSDLRLASARDLDRCRSWIKRHTNGIPAFDSIWIEALRQQGKLTTFQSQMLEVQQGDSLRVSSKLLLTDRQYVDHKLSVFTAKQLQTGEQFLVTRVLVDEVERQPGLQNLISLVDDRRNPDRQQPTSILEAYQTERGLDVVTAFQSGESLDRLVIRRGRFPEKVVRCLAMELASELGAHGSPVHGDLRLANVRLQRNGQAKLINWNILAAIYPELSIHTSLPVDYLQAISPERFNSGLPASRTSDMYALGCLLWQLLAGRAPFQMADPLARIVAHQQQQVPDIRSIAPNTSETFALLIRQMTLRDPHRRLGSYRAIIEQLHEPPAVIRRRLKQFRQTFESAAPRQFTSSSNAGPLKSTNRFMMRTAAVFLTIVAGVIFWNRASLGLPSLSSLAATSQEIQALPDDSASQPYSGTDQAVSTHNNLSMSLPTPSPLGVVRLEGSQTYQTGEIQASTLLQLQATTDQPATVLIDDKPLVLTAEVVRMEHLVIIDARENPVGAAIVIAAQECVIQHCRFERSDGTLPTSCIDWTGMDVNDPRSGRLLVSDSISSGSGTFLTAHLPLTTAAFENSVKLGAGPLIHLTAGVRAGLRVPLVLNHCTLRECGPVVLFSGKELTTSGRLSLQGSGTVFAPVPEQALFALQGMNIHAAWEQHLEVFAEGLVVPQSMPLVQQVTEEGQRLELDSNSMTVDGLLAGKFSFLKDGKVTIQELPVRTSSPSFGANLERLPAK